MFIYVVLPQTVAHLHRFHTVPFFNEQTPQGFFQAVATTAPLTVVTDLSVCCTDAPPLVAPCQLPFTSVFCDKEACGPCLCTDVPVCITALFVTHACSAVRILYDHLFNGSLLLNIQIVSNFSIIINNTARVINLGTHLQIPPWDEFLDGIAGQTHFNLKAASGPFHKGCPAWWCRLCTAQGAQEGAGRD